MGEGSSLRDPCLRDKGDTDFHGKHSLHITQCLLRDSFFHIFNIPMSVLGDEEDRQTKALRIIFQLNHRSRKWTYTQAAPHLTQSKLPSGTDVQQ